MKGNLFFIEVENSFAREIVMNKESGLPESSKANKKFHGMGLINIQRCARKYKGDIDIVIGTSKQKQQIFNLTVMLNGKPVGLNKLGGFFTQNGVVHSFAMQFML